jgi:hypothetical protein
MVSVHKCSDVVNNLRSLRCLWRHAGRVEPGLILGIAGKQTKMTTGSQPVLLWFDRCSVHQLQDSARARAAVAIWAALAMAA